MICKWCAATVTPGDQVCPRCKRELPSLTDCGGFTNITRGLTPPAPLAAAPAAPAAQKSDPAPAAAPAPKKKSPMGWILLLIAGVLLAVMLISLLSLGGQIRDLEGRVDKLQREIKQANERLDEVNEALDELYEDMEEVEDGLEDDDPEMDDEHQKPDDPVDGKPDRDEEDEPGLPELELPVDPAGQTNILYFYVSNDPQQKAVVSNLQSADDYEPAEPSLDYSGRKPQYSLTYPLDELGAQEITAELSRINNGIRLQLDGLGQDDWAKVTDGDEVQSVDLDTWTYIFEDEEKLSINLQIGVTRDDGQEFCLILVMQVPENRR